MSDHPKIDWDFYEYICSLPGSSRLIEIDRAAMAEVIRFVREFQAAANNPEASDMMLILKGWLEAISAPSPSPVLEFALRGQGRTREWHDAWDDGPWAE